MGNSSWYCVIIALCKKHTKQTKYEKQECQQRKQY